MDKLLFLNNEPIAYLAMFIVFVTMQWLGVRFAIFIAMEADFISDQMYWIYCFCFSFVVNLPYLWLMYVFTGLDGFYILLPTCLTFNIVMPTVSLMRKNGKL